MLVGLIKQSFFIFILFLFDAIQPYPWEQYSSGLGRKLMHNMGWNGEDFLPASTQFQSSRRKPNDKRGMGYERGREVPYEKDSDRIVKTFGKMGRFVREEIENTQLQVIILLLVSVVLGVK